MEAVDLQALLDWAVWLRLSPVERLQEEALVVWDAYLVPDWALDPPERRVLEVAIGRREGDGNPPFANQLGFAVVSVAQALAGDGPPLVVAIDDVQWVDAASREVLEFAVRRLPPSGDVHSAIPSVEEDDLWDCKNSPICCKVSAGRSS